MTEPGVTTANQVRTTLATYAIRLSLAAVMGVVIARALSPEGRGGYYVVVIIASTATFVGHLSLGQANVAFWATDRAAIPATNLLLAPVLGILAAVATWGTVTALGPDIVPVPDGRLLLVALATVPVGVIVVHLTTVALLVGRNDMVNRSLTIATVAQCGVLVGLAISGHLSTAVVVWVWAITGALPLVFLVTVLRPHVGRWDLRLARRMLTTAIQYHLGAAALFLLLRVDIFVLNAMSTPAAVGLYSLAVTVGELTYLGSDALSQVILRGQAESSLREARELTIRSVRMSIMVVTGLVAGLAATAPILVPLLYGQAFRDSVVVIYALVPGLLAFGAVRPLGTYLLRLGRPRLTSGLALSAMGVNVALNLLLIPRWGILGCAVASSAGYVLLAGTQIAWFSRAAAVGPTTLLPRRGDAARLWTAVQAVLPVPHRPAASPTPSPGPEARDGRVGQEVSVVTPTFDRAGVLSGAFESLLLQRCVLEWIVVDDGSADGTAAVVREFAEQAPFPVRYLRQEHAGKHAAVNRGVAVARGGMVALLDSDDAVLPGALDRLVRHWRAIPDRLGYVGVTGLDVDESGQVVGQRFAADVVDATWQEMVYRHRITGDKWGILRTDVLREHPFRRGDGSGSAVSGSAVSGSAGNGGAGNRRAGSGDDYVAEGEVWRQIGLRYRTRYVNEPVLSCRTAGADRLTERPFAAIAAGAVRQHTLVLTRDIGWLHRHPRAFVRSGANLVRGLLHLGIAPHRQPGRLGGARALAVWAMCLPLGWILYRRDRRRPAPVPAARQQPEPAAREPDRTSS
jgi:O-antigen/teichoic acid export membrane protein